MSSRAALGEQVRLDNRPRWLAKIMTGGVYPFCIYFNGLAYARRPRPNLTSRRVKIVPSNLQDLLVRPSPLSDQLE